jgi:hypothetical protein
MPGWGLEPYGVGPFGSGSGGQLAITNVLAIATGSVVVTFSVPPLAISPNGINDALNPGTWTIIRADIGYNFPVVNVDALNPLQYRIDVYGSFPDFSVPLEVSAPTVLAADSSQIGPIFSATCPGLIAQAATTPEQVASAMSLSPTDIANPPFNLLTGGGTLQVGPSGDYQSDSGISLLKKLIIRRLVTSPGGFYHLPDYGAGLQVKQALPLGDVVKFQQFIVTQCMKEQGVSNAKASVTVQYGVVVNISLQVQTTQGATFSLGVPLSGPALNLGA